jgi:hypothetical protein
MRRLTHLELLGYVANEPLSFTRLPCGSVFGHTDNTPGYTQFIAASSDGRRSATVSINQQITPTVGSPAAFKRLRAVFQLASCAALAARG